MSPRALRRLLLLGGLLAAVLAVAGCGRTRHLLIKAMPFTHKIRILVWSGYFSQQIFDQFEQAYGVEVEPVIINSNDDLYNVLLGRDPSRPGPFDLAMPSSFMAERLKEEGRIAPFLRRKTDNHFTYLENLDPTDTFSHAGLPNRSENLDRQFNLKSDPNNDYVLPYIWGATGIGYNAEQVAHLPMSWASIFGPDPDHRRRIAMVDDGHFVLGSALIYILYQRYAHSQQGTLSTQEVARRVARGFADATEKDLVEAGQLIKSLRPDVVAINSNSIPRFLATDEANMAIAWSGDVAVAMLRGEVIGEPVAPNLSIRIALPIEGVIVFRDCFVVPRQCRNQEDAEKFLNFLLDPLVAGSVTNYCCYATTVKSATPDVDPDITNSAAYFVQPYPEKNLFLENANPQVSDEAYARVWADVRRSFPPGVFLDPPQILPPEGVAPPIKMP